MIINSRIIIRDRTPIRYITQPGAIASGAGDGAGGVGGSDGGGGVGTDGDGGGIGGIAGSGAGDITGVGTDGVGGDSVVKALTALQVLLVSELIALTFQ